MNPERLIAPAVAILVLLVCALTTACESSSQSQDPPVEAASDWDSMNWDEGSWN